MGMGDERYTRYIYYGMQTTLLFSCGYFISYYWQHSIKLPLSVRVAVIGILGSRKNDLAPLKQFWLIGKK